MQCFMLAAVIAEEKPTSLLRSTKNYIEVTGA